MKVSRLDFLKMIGGGSAAIGAAAATKGGPVFALARPEEVATESRIEAAAPELKPVPKLSYPNGGEYYDAVQGMLFDRITFRRGCFLPNRFEMFNIPRGMDCPYSHIVKDDGYTNMHSMGMLPPPRTFRVERIHIAVSPDAQADDLRMLRKFGWQFTMGQKVYAEGTLLMDGAIRQIADLFTKTPRKTRETRDLGRTGGFYIPSLYYFGVQMRAPSLPAYTLNDDLDIAFAFEGIDFRGIQ